MLNLLILVATIIIMSTKNPVKMSMMIMILTLMTFLILYFKLGYSWISLMITMLFTGGILIMFMMLSSFHSNEISNKMKIIIPLLTLMMMMLINNSKNNEIMIEWNLMQHYKMSFQSIQTSIMMTLLIILYFSSFLKMMKKEKNCMRMKIC